MSRSESEVKSATFAVVNTSTIKHIIGQSMSYEI